MISPTTSTAGPGPAVWPTEPFDQFGAADEIEISTRRSDGAATLRLDPRA